MESKKPIIAMMYDFDKTLCTTNMQDYELIKRLGVTTDAFWSKANSISENPNAPMDRILAYMYQIIKESHAHDQPIKREYFVSLGKSIELFPGVLQWFDRINAYAIEHNATVEHYIISSGLKEMIEGSAIYRHFKRVYACEFHYDVNGVADWPSLAVNYTGKTQFLFRINKQVLDIYDDHGINTYVDQAKRPIPFENMIYIGDGLTDVPCMKLVKSNGGNSICVFKTDSIKAENIGKSLVFEDRVNYIFPADYTENSPLDLCIKQIIDKITL